jgi:RNA polymerase sigma-32 factor
MARTTALPILTADPGLTHYLEEIRRFPMLERQEEYMLAKRWREHGDRDAAHNLVTSHLRLVTKIAMGYRGYGLPISEVISEGNVGLMQAVERFEPEKGFRLATYAVWWIKAAIQEHILRSWSLVKLGTTANQKKVFFNLRKAQCKISILDDGDMRLDQVKIIARRIGVTETDVIDMNRRLRGDASLNAPIRDDGDSGEWQDRLVDESPDQETTLAASEEFDNRRKTLSEALTVLNERERRILEKRRLVEEPITLAELAEEFGVSRERVRQIEVSAFEKVQNAVRRRCPRATTIKSNARRAGRQQGLDPDTAVREVAGDFEVVAPFAAPVLPEPTPAEVQAAAAKEICDAADQLDIPAKLRRPIAEGDELAAYRSRLDKIAKLGGPDRAIVLRTADVKKAAKVAAGPKETKIGEVLKKALSETGITVPEIHSTTGWKKIGGFFTAAKRANLKLSKKRDNKVTTYFASKAA